MKSILSIIGAIFILIGIIGLSYKYFSYTTNEKVAEIGSVKITAEQEKTVLISPMASGLILAAGVAFVLIGLARKS